jgi:metallo-beta-lactamase class B
MTLRFFQGERFGLAGRFWQAGVAGLAFLALSVQAVVAQVQVTPLPVTNEEWEQPYEGFRVVGNLYHVGTYDLSAFLITTDEGHILINSGVASSVAMIRQNIEDLGFNFEDIKIITATHAHHDHVAGLGEIQDLTGAETYFHEFEVPVVTTGGNDDYRYPNRGVIYEPIEVDHVLTDGSTIELGGVVLTVHHHPGHTRGAVSFTYDVEEGGETYHVLIANMGSVNQSTNFANMPGFPDVAEAYAKTFASQKAMNPDIWVASHAGHFALHEKRQPGDAYDPQRFYDPEGWHEEVNRYEALYLERLAADMSAAAGGGASPAPADDGHGH